MGIPAIKERRIIIRKRLTGLMPARISVQNTLQDISCRPVDISENGLGIITSAQLQSDTILQLKLKAGVILLMVKWSEPDFGKQDLIRYGLATVDESIDLEAVFAEFGCLK